MEEIISKNSLIKTKSGDKITITSRSLDVPFYKVGNGNTNQQGTSMNLIQEMAKMSKPELFLISMVEDKLSYYSEFSTGEVCIDTSDLTSTQKQYITNGYKKLYNKNILRRTRRSHYIINPLLILPRAINEATELWEASLAGI